jgi:hypothetical protein
MRANRSSRRSALIGRWLGCVRGASGAEGYPGYLKLAVAHASRSALSTVHAQQSVAATTQQGSMLCTVGSIMCDVPLVHVPDAHGANRALELRAPTILRRILMRLRGVRILVPEGTLTCRTHTTQHELSAIAPNVQWVQLFASLGFADIRVGATSADIAVEAVRTCTHARMHAASCDACTQVPAALKPSRNCANQICWRSRRLLPLHCRFAGLTHSTLHTQRAAHATKSRRASPVSAAALPQVGLPARWSSVDCRWQWSACDEPVFAADNRCVLAQCGTGPQLQ